MNMRTYRPQSTTYENSISTELNAALFAPHLHTIATVFESATASLPSQLFYGDPATQKRYCATHAELANE